MILQMQNIIEIMVGASSKHASLHLGIKKAVTPNEIGDATRLRIFLQGAVENAMEVLEQCNSIYMLMEQ
jgi:hypothetical protein